MTYLANIEDGKRVSSAHQQFGIVFVQGPLVITNGRGILDDDQVIRVFTLLGGLAVFSLGSGFGIELGRGLEQQRVGSDHVVDHRGFTNLL